MDHGLKCGLHDSIKTSLFRCKYYNFNCDFLWRSILPESILLAPILPRAGKADLYHFANYASDDLADLQSAAQRPLRQL